MQGPTLPSRDDLVLLRESAEDQRMAERAYARKRERAEDKERIEDLVGPRESGREGALEKKRIKRESDRSFRDARDDAFGDYDESTLMGGGDSFQAQYVIPFRKNFDHTYDCVVSLGEMLQNNAFKKSDHPNEMIKLQHYGYAKRLCVKETKQQWRCSNKWQRRSMAKQYNAVRIHRYRLNTYYICSHYQKHMN